MNTTTAADKPKVIAHIERELEYLYRAGHATGYGAGQATCNRGADCLGCADARRLADAWDIAHGLK